MSAAPSTREDALARHLARDRGRVRSGRRTSTTRIFSGAARSTPMSMIAPVRFTDIALLDRAVVAEDDNTDVVVLEVERQRPSRRRRTRPFRRTESCSGRRRARCHHPRRGRDRFRRCPERSSGRKRAPRGGGELPARRYRRRRRGVVKPAPDRGTANPSLAAGVDTGTAPREGVRRRDGAWPAKQAWARRNWPAARRIIVAVVGGAIYATFPRQRVRDAKCAEEPPAELAIASPRWQFFPHMRSGRRFGESPRNRNSP